MEQLASRALTRSQERRRLHVRPAPATPGAEGGEAEETESEGQREVDRVDAVVVNFARPRDAAEVAALTRCRVIRPESLVWLEGYQALRRWRAEHEITGLHAVAYDVETTAGSTDAFPLGRWVHQQRRALRAGELDPHRKELLDEAGMVWEPGEEAWEAKLAALRSYRRATRHLAPRQDTVWGEGEAMVPIGQHMANLRRKGGLGKDTERAAKRAQQLSAIDPDWNCPWPLDWQRHYRVLADLVDADGVLPYIAPGIVFDGDDLGTWRWRQQKPGTWAQLSAEQRERLTTLGLRGAVLPLTAAVSAEPPPAPADAAKGASKAQQAFQRGLAALAQYKAREGHMKVSRAHAETVVVDDQEHTVKLGVFLSNTKSRRGKLTADQRQQLANIGLEWA